MRRIVLVLLFVNAAAVAQAGLYYSGERIAALPSQWRGFLLDQRALRGIAITPKKGQQPAPLRAQYLEDAKRLENLGRSRRLQAEEVADLGALYIRLGEHAKAVDILRRAQQQYPGHFHIVANLGSAWQALGDLRQAAGALREAVRLAPGNLEKAERLHLRLVEGRENKPASTQELDDLFGVRFEGENGTYTAGQLSAKQAAKLPADAAAFVQQLALWLPADGRLLWQLAELANASGDVRMAAAMMDGCVTEFGMHDSSLRLHRRLLRSVADNLAENAPPSHTGHAAGFKPSSRRPLISLIDDAKLPPIGNGINALPWSVLAETAVDRKFRPTFPKYLEELNHKQVALSGYVQPLTEEAEISSFLLIENPVGCWYCEMPGPAGIVHVQLGEGKSIRYGRGVVHVSGELILNASDAEDFIFTIRKASVKLAD
jgi:tetratricopeptide (TPR) repeat protein